MSIDDHGHHDPDDCTLCRYRSVSIAASSMPTRSTAAQQKKFSDATDRDLPAYKRLKDDGIQPTATNGAAEMERRATEKFEVETGQLAPDRKTARRYQKAFDEVAAS